MLQSEAGYIDARPQSRQIDETLLQRTAGPYIGSKPEILCHYCTHERRRMTHQCAAILRESRARARAPQDEVRDMALLRPDDKHLERV